MKEPRITSKLLSETLLTSRSDALLGFDDEESSLLPHETGNDVVVRFVFIPMYSSTNTEHVNADGVLIAGDIVNGKLAISHKVVNLFQEGYSGVFLFGDTSFNFELLSSTLYDESNGIVYDQEIDDNKNVDDDDMQAWLEGQFESEDEDEEEGKEEKTGKSVVF